MGELGGCKVFESECVEDNGLEVGVTDKIVQLPHRREFMVGVQTGGRRR